ncbi:Gfo/Idh/MocA family protein [Sinorhizobium meliloti]|uniref:Gfo/Idh/MocA family protein n=1 Tax=Rhizobium meliloti TaxID=382 RepID=UPI001F1C2EE4|nr:Gfo/Idh/MocA family oxidoreductase [Sinorhizobium meliloti]
MTMTKVKIGIVGTGFIATILAPQIQSSKKARLDAVSSRTLAKAESFVANYPGAIAVEGADQLIARDDGDAVYIATPTSAKEDVASRALTAGKHVLIEKPLHSAASFKRLSALARQKGLVLMDATHFVHHPRTSAMRQRLAALIGAPRSLHTMFYFPFSDRENIRFDPSDEPVGAATWPGIRCGPSSNTSHRTRSKISRSLPSGTRTQARPSAQPASCNSTPARPQPSMSVIQPVRR